ncbi:hypothetical protein PLICRDRAFT_693829 [Plicaturopsis crispa FD-325 SS-3]|nr:hypothetical protein PLICRDRAFT_693829 [Plicaturopsis crispa FD-325 SS-3]
MTFNLAALRALPRATLQKLARDNNVKANGKTEAMINDLLSKRDAEGVQPSPDMGKTVPPQAAQGASTSAESAGAGSTRMATPSSTADIPSPKEPARERSETPYLYDNPAHTSPPQSPGKPQRLQPSDPCPKEQFLRTVAIMEAISARDRQTLERCTHLRKRAAQARQMAEDYRTAARAERARRQRLEAYFMYWRQCEAEWKTTDIWSGVFREVQLDNGEWIEAGSDEELENEAVLPESNLTTLKAGDIVTEAHADARRPQAAAEAPADAAYAAQNAVTGQPSNLPSPPSSPPSSKRRRATDAGNAEEEEKTRHSPRRRVHDKGKGKMSAEELDALHLEEQLEEPVEKDPRGHFDEDAPDDTQETATDYDENPLGVAALLVTGLGHPQNQEPDDLVPEDPDKENVLPSSKPTSGRRRVTRNRF